MLTSHGPGMGLMSDYVPTDILQHSCTSISQTDVRTSNGSLLFETEGVFFFKKKIKAWKEHKVVLYN